MALAVAAAGVGDEPDSQPAELAEMIVFQDIDAIEHGTCLARRGTGAGRGGFGFERAGDVEEIEVPNRFGGERGQLIAQFEHAGATGRVVAVG